MRVALLSDLHGNAIAFEAALADVARQGVDRLICLGDVAALGAQPGATIERLQGLNCPVVMGNTDEWLLNPVLKEPEDEEERRSQDTELWSAQQLTDDHRAFMRTFQPTVAVELEAGSLLVCYHGSPRSNTDIILPETPEADVRDYFKGWQAEVFAGGHTHEPMVRRFGTAAIVNPGSVGLPAHKPTPDSPEQLPHWAEYALVTAQAGVLSVELRRVPYDVAPVARAILASGMPHAAAWAERWQ